MSSVPLTHLAVSQDVLGSSQLDVPILVENLSVGGQLVLPEEVNIEHLSLPCSLASSCSSHCPACTPAPVKLSLLMREVLNLKKKTKNYQSEGRTIQYNTITSWVCSATLEFHYRLSWVELGWSWVGVVFGLELRSWSKKIGSRKKCGS